MSKVIVRRDFTEENNLPDSFHPVLRRVFSARNITNPAQLDTSLQNLLPYDSILNIQQAVSLLTDSLMQQRRIMMLTGQRAVPWRYAASGQWVLQISITWFPAGLITVMV